MDMEKRKTKTEPRNVLVASFALLAFLAAAVLMSTPTRAFEVHTPETITSGIPTTFSVSETLNDTASLDEMIFEWHFSDSEENVTGEEVTHAFHGPGTYEVSVTARYKTNHTVYDTKTISVNVEPDRSGMFLAMVGAGIAVGISGMGSGIGVGLAGSAGSGAIVYRPNRFSKFLLFQALPQTQAIYGFLVAIIIFLRTGVWGGEAVDVPFSTGLLFVGAGLAVGIAGLSAIGQGITAASAIGAAAEREDTFTRGMIFSVLPETQAIYGFLVAVLLIFMGTSKISTASSAYGMGVAAIGAGLAVGVAGLSAIGQGIAAGAGITSYVRSPETFVRSMLFSIMSELFAIFGLLIAIIIMFSVGII